MDVEELTAMIPPEIPGDDKGMPPHEESPIEYEIIKDEEYFEEMATITRDAEEGVCIRVNEERTKLSIAYFKAYNHSKPSAATKVARFHFKDKGMEYRCNNPEGKNIWDISSEDIRKVITVLKKRSEQFKGYTNWQSACYQWNYENDLIDEGITAYLSGKYDKRLKDNPAYVPSTQPMPKGWAYNPPDVESPHEDSEEPSMPGEPFFEMSGRIPGEIRVNANGNHTLIVAVGADETTGIAHFHVYRSQNDLNTWSNGACLMFTEGRYFSHEKHDETLNHDELDAVVAKLKEKPSKDLPGKTNWEYLIFLWNAGNYDRHIPLTTPMPVYDYNTITRYTE